MVLFILALTNYKLHKKVRWLHLWSSQRTRKCLGGAWIIICPNVDTKRLILVLYACMTLDLIIFIHILAYIHPHTPKSIPPNIDCFFIFTVKQSDDIEFFVVCWKQIKEEATE